MVTVKINGKEVRIPANTPLLDAARQIGIRIPTLCHHPDLEPYGVCRVCMVECRRGGRTRFVTACNFPVQDGLEVFTDTETVRELRKMLIELLLAQAPKAPDIQALAREYDIDKTRFPIADPDNNCHLCGLCVRTCNEIVGANAIGFSGRGVTREVRTPVTIDPELCLGCGACTFVCPTGHIQMEQIATQHFRECEPSKRPCRWARLGVVSQLNCPNNFECFHCEIDQGLEDRFGTHPALVVKPAQKRVPQKVGRFLWAPDRAYHPGHVWLKVVGDVALVGLDDFARNLVGSIEDLRAAARGDRLELGGAAWEISCGPRKARMVAPVRGRVVEVNPLLADDPGVVCRDPYGRGWILAIAAEKPEDDLQKLLRDEPARAWLEADSGRLQRKLGVDLGTTLADGGEVAADLPARLSEKDWASLVRTFFLT